MANIQNFTQDSRVIEAVTRIKTQCHGRQISDIIDDEGNQYVDLVMEGGGVLGIALTGYTYALEQAGIRFLGIGGTSAGSINALMIAALGTSNEAKSEKLVNVLAEMPMAAFIDGDSDAHDFSSAVIQQEGMIKLLWKGMQVVDNLKEDLGLNPGKVFFDWLDKQLENVGIRTNTDLMTKLAIAPPGLRARDGAELFATDKCGRLAMIAADITTETKVEFPKMAELYWAEPGDVKPACFARASMSIPFFFHPFSVSDCPQNKNDEWKKAGYFGTAPTSVMFMDGGIMSNFPINLFHQPYRVPRTPTFGAKIGVERNQPVIISSPKQLMGAVFNAARHTLDVDFITQNPDYRHLVAMIDTGNHNWLNFTMQDKDKIDLFARGAQAAADFLCNFDWPSYKAIRKDIAEVFLKAKMM